MTLCDILSVEFETMLRITRRILVFITVSLVATGLAACGGGTFGEVVAQVGEYSITRAEVSHWMSTLAGGDFIEVSKGHTVPAGLVSEPPNYAACVARLEAVAVSPATGRPKPTAAQLLSKCRQLYQALRLQALSFLVESKWMIGLYGEEGLKVTDAEVVQLFKRIEAELSPKEEFQQYLARRRRSLSDELFIVKLDVLRQKAAQKLNTGGKQMLAEFTEAGRRWTARTSCRAGYVVQHCKQYTGQSAPSLASPAVLLEQVAGITGRPCINRGACG